MSDFGPINELEKSLVSAKSRQMAVEVFLRQMLNTDLALPSISEVGDDGNGFAPLTYDRHGTPMLAAFTDPGRIGALSDVAQYCLVMNGLQVLRRIPPGHGVVINPGLEMGLDLSPDGIKRILSELV